LRLDIILAVLGIAVLNRTVVLPIIGIAVSTETDNAPRADGGLTEGRLDGLFGVH
jgi:hypothetical protein